MENVIERRKKKGMLFYIQSTNGTQVTATIGNTVTKWKRNGKITSREGT